MIYAAITPSHGSFCLNVVKEKGFDLKNLSPKILKSVNKNKTYRMKTLTCFSSYPFIFPGDLMLIFSAGFLPQ